MKKYLFRLNKFCQNCSLFLLSLSQDSAKKRYGATHEAKRKKRVNKRRETKLVQGSNTTTLPTDNQALY